MRLTRLVYLLLIFVITWSIYYLMSVHKDVQTQVSPNVELPMFSGQSLENITYGKDGIRSYVINSTNLDHYSKSGNTIFLKPTLMMYRDGKVIEWEMTAKRAVLHKNQTLTLYDNVLMKNLLPGASFQQLQTDKLVINLVNRDFNADQQVKLVGPQFTTTSGAMQGNLKQHIATLTNKVQGRYETVTP